MKKNILFTANLESFFTKFLIPQLKFFKEKGYIVHIATKIENLDIPYCDKKFDVDFARGLSIKKNIKSYKQMKKILKTNHYDIISCHTPFGGAITRLAAHKCHLQDVRIVYMAHGFHFYKGAPIINWLIFYNVEKYLAKYTDEIITINMEDFYVASKKFKTKVSYVAGVGLDTEKFDLKMSENEKKLLRKNLGLKDNDFVMIYPAELSDRKRQVWLINTLYEILIKNNNFHLLLPGKDTMNGYCQNLVKKLNLDKQVHLLGFRNDIPQLLNISDLAVSSSKQEGLPVNIMEAIYVGLPVIATDCRGNRDLIEDKKNGFIIEKNNKEEFCKEIMNVYNFSEMDKNKIKNLDKKIIKKYLKENVLNDIIKIYLNK